MRTIARTLRAVVRGAAPRRTLTGAALASLAMTAAVGIQAAPASAATLLPTVTSAFTPNEIGAGNSTALSVTITNPNPATTLTSIGFTDTLPAGLSIDNPNGESGSCGATSVVTANPGSNTLSLAGGSLKAVTACTISVSVASTSAGTVSNDSGAVSSSAGTTADGDIENLTILPPPTLTVSNPKNNAKYTYGSVVKARFSCSQFGDPTQLQDCSALDDLGNTFVSGQALDTKVPGPHNLTISATSADGLVTTDTINYTVLPDNVITASHVKATSSGAVSLQLAVPGPGKLTVSELAGTTTLGTLIRTLTAGHKALKLTVKPSTAPAAGTKVKLQITYTPKGGVKRTLVKSGIAIA